MRTALALLVASVISACGGGDSTANSTDVPFSTVAQSNYSGVMASEGVVARSQSEFNDVWARYSANLSSPPQPPAIDFNAMQIIGFFLGTRPNGCYSMSITRVSNTGNRLIVAYKEQVAAAGDVCTLALVTPAHLVAVPTSQLQVEFVAE